MPWHPCINSRDTITQDDGLILQNFVTLDGNQHTVSSHCRDANGTWITWFDDTRDGSDDGFGAGYNDISTYTGNTFPVHVGYFPDDGSDATVYDLAVGYIWDWKALGRYSNVSPCAIRAPASSKYFGNNVQCELVGWNTGVQDVQVRTDGTNVWVVVLAQESVMYPWLSDTERLDRCGVFHKGIFEDATDEGLTPGEDGNPFLHDTTGAGSNPLGGTWWQQSGVIGVDDPDDAGLHSSFRWQPMRVTVFGGDLGGFTRLGTLEAQFFNTAGDTAAIGLSSGIEAAASPAEPGVLHTLWAEAGTQDQFQAGQGERVSYAQWDVGGLVSGYDIPGTGWTAEMILRNDHGSPAAIIIPWDFSELDAAGIVGTLGPPQYWDLSTGTVVQELDTDLYPTPAEAGTATTLSPTGGLLSLSGSIFTTGDFHRRHFASSIYNDPTDMGRDVYIVCIGFNEGSGGGGNEAAAFYRIPVDGSAPFDYMDGVREPMYSILPRDLTRQYVALLADFISDPGNVWMPVGGGEVLHLPRTCERTWELLDAFPSVATVRPGQFVNEGSWVLFGNQVYAPTSPPVIVTDASDNDWLVAGGILSDLTSTDQTTPAALWARICRCCVPCIERIGLHIWEKV